VLIVQVGPVEPATCCAPAELEALLLLDEPDDDDDDPPPLLLPDEGEVHPASTRAAPRASVPTAAVRRRSWRRELRMGTRTATGTPEDLDKVGSTFGRMDGTVEPSTVP
jgi:hypothetical protein